MAVSGVLALLYGAGNSVHRTLVVVAVLALAIAFHLFVKRAGRARM
jgi:hypothetical protein